MAQSHAALFDFHKTTIEYLEKWQSLRTLLEDPDTSDEELRKHTSNLNQTFRRKIVQHCNVSIETLLSMSQDYDLILELRPDLPNWAKVQMTLGRM